MREKKDQRVPEEGGSQGRFFVVRLDTLGKAAVFQIDVQVPFLKLGSDFRGFELHSREGGNANALHLSPNF